MKIRVFGSRYCSTCLNLCKDLHGIGMDYIWIDADEDESEDLCDVNEVDYLPHIQIADGDRVVFNHAGPLLAADIKLIYERMIKKKARSAIN